MSKQSLKTCVPKQERGHELQNLKKFLPSFPRLFFALRNTPYDRMVRP
jgi:hypothetical protein